MSEHKTPIISSKVANPIPGLFPHAVRANGLIFVSGSIGMDVNCKVVEGGIQEHTRQIIKNFQNVLEEAGSELGKIVKLNVFITDMDNFSAMIQAYMEYFKEPSYPSRTCVAVKELPFGTDVEMECTALA